MPVIVTYAAGVLLLVPAWARAQEPTSGPTPARTIVVSGTGAVQSPPDVADIDVGVVTEGQTAAEAVQENNNAVQAVLDALKDRDIADRDVQTRSFEVSPRYEQNPPRRDLPPKIVGYQVTNRMHIRVRKLKSMGQVLDRVVTAGANRIDGIRFALDDPAQMMDQARRKAVRDAAHKAGLLAQEAGVTLGGVLEIRDVTSGPGPVPQRRLMLAEDRSVPVATGELTVTCQIQVTYLITPATSSRESADRAPSGTPRNIRVRPGS